MIEQRSPIWFAQRAGKLTASRFADVMGARAAREKYKREVVFERMARTAKHEIGGKALAWGIDVEDPAKSAYSIATGNIVVPAEFVLHPRYDFIGASGDGWIGTDGGVEAKCPHDEAVHVETWLTGMPQEHVPQVQGNMAVTGRRWWDFISYDPRQAPEFRLYVERIERDDKYIAKLLGALVVFNDEVEAMLAEIRLKAAA